jgi:hypothetical protein
MYARKEGGGRSLVTQGKEKIASPFRGMHRISIWEFERYGPERD